MNIGYSKMNDFIDWLINARFMQPVVASLEWVEDKVKGRGPITAGEKRYYGIFNVVVYTCIFGVLVFATARLLF